MLIHNNIDSNTQYNITFYVFNNPIPFLLLLKNINALSIYLNNTRNEFVKHNKTRVRIIKRFGYPWFFFNASIYVINKILITAEKKIAGFLFLTKTELRRVYKRFNHLSDFNYEIVINVCYLSNKPVLYVINKSIKFNAAAILKNLFAKKTWKTLKRYWINVYLKPLNPKRRGRLPKNKIPVQLRNRLKPLTLNTKSNKPLKPKERLEIKLHNKTYLLPKKAKAMRLLIEYKAKALKFLKHVSLKKIKRIPEALYKKTKCPTVNFRACTKPLKPKHFINNPEHYPNDCIAQYKLWNGKDANKRYAKPKKLNVYKFRKKSALKSKLQAIICILKAKKKLIINLIALRKFYKNKEIDEIRWIAGTNNPANAITKKQLNRALKELHYLS
ncbi:hypothetical protein GGTG_00460 [Gaeumannomyces tritici R3-111a-1]|uniref:Uncharacterized protein n=1 Tax=Gaeumannomyces tritici (strain R3-111a-1) TaxID=644352 RepID=J3NGS1_GAET3|nr:hypothetical protein GGTG_00460 [Gaeumannomyces tritici R3-111a-1]EJT80461.1 hypothetical protein GGTG_00460 [Gaeumannomyces tritici R3-111a-1]